MSRFTSNNRKMDGMMRMCGVMCFCMPKMNRRALLLL